MVYNIARCHDRLEHTREAIESYEQYLQAAPVADDAGETRKRILVLRTRLAAESAASPGNERAAPSSTASEHASPLPPRVDVLRGRSVRDFRAPIVVGAVALASAAVGAGLLGSVAADFHSLKSTCGTPPMCTRESWAALPAREYSAEALLGVAAVLVVVDVVLWAIEARHPRRDAPAAAVLEGRF
jgi:hypothetical protein